MAYTPGTTFTFTGGYTPGTSFTFQSDGSTLTATGEGSAAFVGASLAQAFLSAQGEGNASFTGLFYASIESVLTAHGEGNASFAGTVYASIGSALFFGEGNASFSGSAIISSSLLAGGEGNAYFDALTGYMLTAGGEGHANFTGLSIPPTISKGVLKTRYLLTHQGRSAFTVDRTAYWVGRGFFQGTWTGSYWQQLMVDNAITLDVSGSWAVGFRPSTISIDFGIVHTSFDDPNFDLENLIFNVVMTCAGGDMPVLSAHWILGRQTLTFALPTLTSDITSIVFWFLGVRFVDYIYRLEIHGISFTYVDMGAEEYLPMSNFSVSSRSGSPSAINATVPYTPGAMAIVTGYQSGTLRVYREQTYTDGADDTTLVETGSLTHLQLDQGPMNASIVLTGQATRTNTAPKYVVLQGLSYYASVDGKQRIRCAPFNGLNVGDTVKAGSHTLVANNIQLSVSVTQELMEIYE
jgi:hypothetical protein